MSHYALDGRDEVGTLERVVLAHLAVDEFPVHVDDQIGWFDLCDRAGNQVMSEVVKRCRDENGRQRFDYALLDGSLLWCRTLGSTRGCTGSNSACA